VSAFDTDKRGVGKNCFVGCSKKCFNRCLKGSYDVPASVGRCDTPYCKMLKRTMLDMEGVFSQTTQWTEKAEVNPIEEVELAQKSHESIPVPDLDVSEVSKETDLKPEEIEQIMTGKRPTASRISAKSLADSVLFDLSDEDRAALEAINHS